MELGVFNGNLTRYKGCDTLEKLARTYLRVRLREEGIEVNSKDEWKPRILEYLESWCEWSQDMDEPCNDPFLMIDVAVDNLAYSNVHFMNLKTMSEISRDQHEKVVSELYRMMYLPFKKD